MLKFLYYSFLFIISIISLIAVFSISILWNYGNDLPDYTQLQSYKTKAMTRLYSSNDNIIQEYAKERRVFIPYEAIPQLVVNAFIATEDKNFFKHDGLDFKGICRAFILNIKYTFTGKRLVGASTITQQVAKNFLLTSEVSFDRKIKEALLALRIERTLSKEQILELYLNEIFLGFRSYGIAVASQNYFNKSIDELDLSEIAFLAGLPKGPNNYHPIKKYNSAIARRNYVLSRLYEEGMISRINYSNSLKSKINVVRNNKNINFKADYFSEEVRKIIINKYNETYLYNEGLYVLTTLDEELQSYAEESLKAGLEEYDRRQGWRGKLGSLKLLDLNSNWLSYFKNYKLENKESILYAVILEYGDEDIKIGFLNGENAKLDIYASSWIINTSNKQEITIDSYKNNLLNLGDIIIVQKSLNYNKDNKLYKIHQIPEANGAIVALDAYTGNILALVGGYNFNNNKFNRATQARRQAGSAFKPFVYLAALEQGLTPSSLILDSPLVIDQGPGLSEWIPKNYSGTYYGLSTLRTGLEKSRNVMTVRLANTIGIEKIVEIGNRFNIGNYPAQLATALGAGETTLLNLTTAYASFINGGKLVTPNYIETIHDRYGKILYPNTINLCKYCGNEFIGNKIFDKSVNTLKATNDKNAFQIAWMLNGVIKNGTGKSLKSIDNYIGGKTGTTNDNKDAWFIGFSSNLVVGVYVGHDLPRSLGGKETGGKVAAPIWGKFMKDALLKYPSNPFKLPRNIEMVKVDYISGLLPNSDSSKIIYEAFVPGSAPKTYVIKPSGDINNLKPLDGQIY
ncbi:MAG: PBP1A family penicillin-binding protein [Pelagibacterales bacterium]|nr:PBP1A family penicillin-binding protein [Pelagibacterales bacterium]